MRPCLLLAAALAMTVQPVRLAAQEGARSPLELIEDWYEVYLAAYHRYQATVGDFRIVEGDWDRRNDEYLQLRETNPARADRILGEIQQLSAEKTRAESGVRAAQREWQDAGDSLIQALDNYLEILNNAIQGTPLGDSIEELVRQYTMWDRRLEEVEAQLAPSLSLELEPMPAIVARDDDTAEDLELKAKSLENRARRDSALVLDVEDKIASLKKRQERERSTADLRARIARFGDMTVPVEAATGEAGVTVADSAAVDLTQTPEQRIEDLETFRDEMIARVDQLLERARELRQEAARRRA